MATDARYTRSQDSVTASDVESMIASWRTPIDAMMGTECGETEREFVFVLPEGALTDSGVLFSFQPYEIDCWAAGAYHFIVPYKKLMPFLTNKAKALIQ